MILVKKPTNFESGPIT